MNSVSSFHIEPHAPEGADGTILSTGLGLFGLGLGAAQLAVPRLVARGIGLDPDGWSPIVLRALGARELASGLSILLQPRRPVPLWARVAGDVMDAALIGLAAGTAKKVKHGGWFLLGAAAAVAGVAALDVLAARRTQQAYVDANTPVIFSVTINKPPREVYDFFRDFAQLPEFMDYLESVEERGGNVSRWTAKLPVGGTVSWDARIVDDHPGEVIAWQSVAGSTIQTRGRVTFARAPGRESTEVRVEMQLGRTVHGAEQPAREVVRQARRSRVTCAASSR